MIYQKAKESLKKGLPTAVFEVLLIFVGITLALAFDNWNNERNERALEREYLTSIYNNLQNNFRQIEDNMRTNTSTYLISQKNISLFLQGENYNEATLINDFGMFGGYKTLSLETSGYTSLKSHGLHLVRNAELRNEIIELHDRHFDRIVMVWEGIKIRSQIPNLWVPIMYQHYDSKYTIDDPEDYKKHLNDTVPLRNVYAWAYGHNLSVAINTVPVYRHIHELSEKLERKLGLPSKSKERLQSVDFWEYQVENNWPVIDPVKSSKQNDSN